MRKYEQAERRAARSMTPAITGVYLLVASLLTVSWVRAETVDPEWPCVQALIPEVALAVMWPLPLDESIQGKWRDDKSIASLAETLGDLESFGENEEKIIDDFAAAQVEANLENALSQLAEGVVTVSNRLRTQYIRGIKRYTRQQISIASQIEAGLNELAAADGQMTDGQRELEESLKWHERVYDQREQAIPALCERPVELEEKLSSVLRHLSRHLP